MADLIQQKRGTTAYWELINPVLADGEIAIEKAVSGFKVKIGDGVTAWNSLPYTVGNSGGGYPIITIGGRPYELRKTVNLGDLAKVSTLETDDIVFGTPASGSYVFAKRLAGGDADDINDVAAYEIFGGI